MSLKNLAILRYGLLPAIRFLRSSRLLSAFSVFAKPSPFIGQRAFTKPFSFDGQRVFAKSCPFASQSIFATR